MTLQIPSIKQDHRTVTALFESSYMERLAAFPFHCINGPLILNLHQIITRYAIHLVPSFLIIVSPTLLAKYDKKLSNIKVHWLQAILEF